MKKTILPLLILSAIALAFATGCKKAEAPAPETMAPAQDAAAPAAPEAQGTVGGADTSK